MVLGTTWADEGRFTVEVGCRYDIGVGNGLKASYGVDTNLDLGLDYLFGSASFENATAWYGNGSIQYKNTLKI